MQTCSKCKKVVPEEKMYFSEHGMICHNCNIAIDEKNREHLDELQKDESEYAEAFEAFESTAKDFGLVSWEGKIAIFFQLAILILGWVIMELEPFTDDATSNILLGLGGGAIVFGYLTIQKDKSCTTHKKTGMLTIIMGCGAIFFGLYWVDDSYDYEDYDYEDYEEH